MKRYFLIVLLTVFAVNLRAQAKLDSLFGLWEDSSQPDSIRLLAMQSIAMEGYLFSQPDSAFYYAQLQYELAESKGLKKQMANALIIQGASFQFRNNYPRALDYYHKSLAVYEELSDKQGMANILGNIGLIHKDQKDYQLALEYFQKSLVLKKELGDQEGIANSLSNIGIAKSQLGDDTIALDYFHQALQIDEELGNTLGMATSLNNMGMIHRRQGESKRAIEHYQRSVHLSKQTGDLRGIANSLVNLGNLKIELGEVQSSFEYCLEGLKLAKEVEALDLQINACKCLHNAHKTVGNHKDALGYHERLLVLQDSVFNAENTQQLTRLEMQYEFDKQEALRIAEQAKKDALAAQEMRREKLVRNGFMGGFAVVLLFAAVFFFQRNNIGKEKERSEALLLNILPGEVAEELKEKGHSDAQLMDEVSVLFTDFKGFTALSEKVSPKELVADLHECFSAFDHICEEYGIEKIKTIGDAYMAAGGLPKPKATHAQDVIQAALDMARFVENGKARKIEKGLPYFEVRIGIHTGPVVAGIVGVKKFAYDIWGDTVNTASRMESSGEAGKVNVSEATYALVKDDPNFTFESRGKIEAKGKGKIEMYFASKASG